MYLALYNLLLVHGRFDTALWYEINLCSLALQMPVADVMNGFVSKVAYKIGDRYFFSYLYFCITIL